MGDTLNALRALAAAAHAHDRQARQAREGRDEAITQAHREGVALTDIMEAAGLACGDGVAAPVAQWIGERLARHLQHVGAY